jgi:hypothetical protein
MMRAVNTTPRLLYPWERPGTHCIGGWVGPRAGLDGCGEPLPHRDSIPDLHGVTAPLFLNLGARQGECSVSRHG